jgi:hypothetical protein
MFSIGEYASFSRDSMTPDSPYFVPQSPPTIGNIAHSNPPYTPRNMFQEGSNSPMDQSEHIKHGSMPPPQPSPSQHKDQKKETFKNSPEEIVFIPSPSPSIPSIPTPTTTSSSSSHWIHHFFIIFIVLSILLSIVFSFLVPLGSVYEKRFRLFANSLIGISIIVLAYVLYLMQSM